MHCHIQNALGIGEQRRTKSLFSPSLLLITLKINENLSKTPLARRLY
jgi:hypothetical protein